MNKYITLNKQEYSKQFIEKVEAFEACFDCQVMTFPEDKSYEIVNHMIWRSIKDCHRNAAFTYAQAHFSHKQLHKKNSAEIIQMLLEKGIDWEKDVPLYLKHGVYGKKELYEKEVEVNGEIIKATRQRVANKCFKINEYEHEKMLELMLAKNWIINSGGIVNDNFEPFVI